MKRKKATPKKRTATRRAAPVLKLDHRLDLDVAPGCELRMERVGPEMSIRVTRSAVEETLTMPYEGLVDAATAVTTLFRHLKRPAYQPLVQRNLDDLLLAVEGLEHALRELGR